MSGSSLEGMAKIGALAVSASLGSTNEGCIIEAPTKKGSLAVI
jgi:hypothetical protein